MAVGPQIAIAKILADLSLEVTKIDRQIAKFSAIRYTEEHFVVSPKTLPSPFSPWMQLNLVIQWNPS